MTADARLLRALELSDGLARTSSTHGPAAAELRQIIRRLVMEDGGQRGGLAVRFTEAEEFVSEVEAEHRAGRLRPPLVRVTQVAKPSADGLWTIVSVVATARSCDDVVLRLEKHCGELWGTARDEGVRDHAAVVVAHVSEAAGELGLDVRAGILHHASTGPWS